jgi:hypothetical protein
MSATIITLDDARATRLPHAERPEMNCELPDGAITPLARIPYDVKMKIMGISKAQLNMIWSKAQRDEDEIFHLG